MSGHGEKRSRRQEAAIAALLSTSTIGEAAKVAKVSERTLRTWLRDPAFLQEFRAVRARLVEVAVGGLQDATREAVAALRRALTCGTPGVEVRAAAEVLSQATKGIELWDLENRLALLEDQLQQRSSQ